METLIVIIIVGLAVAYLITNTVKSSKKEDSCGGCTCESCPTAVGCKEEVKDDN